jgi:hypothetical protein
VRRLERIPISFAEFFEGRSPAAAFLNSRPDARRRARPRKAINTQALAQRLPVFLTPDASLVSSFHNPVAVRAAPTLGA